MEKKLNFMWEKFYTELAGELLKYKNNRKELVEKSKKMYELANIELPSLLKNDNIDDIDPFTFYAFFNRGYNGEDENLYNEYVKNRISLISAIGNLFNIKSEVPTIFDSIPTILHNTARYFRLFEDGKMTKKSYEDINLLWEFFECALNFVKDSSKLNAEKFIKLFDKAINIKSNKRSKITGGLYWIAPETFLTLDQNTYSFIYDKNGVFSRILNNLPEKKTDNSLSGKEYMEIIKNVKEFLNSNESSIKSFKELSRSAYERKNDNTVIKGHGENKIYYGVPGCGKSFQANKDALNITHNENLIIRTVFYPDYTNSDFIGQIIPNLNDDKSILYSIQGGPFTEALALAIDNPSKKVCLIIDEINRGNAAAIFGDIFQLLDRNSNYRIRNYIISEYLKKNCQNKNFDFENILIPNNLYIYATMNTSDQNVYTLDTAFKRRWNMKYVKNNLDAKELKNKIVPILNMQWTKFVIKINQLIIEAGKSLDISGEDKQLGAFFISLDEWKKIESAPKEEATLLFAEKVLSYLWEDVAKFNKTAIFNEDFNTFDDVLTKFVEKKGEIFAFKEENK